MSPLKMPFEKYKSLGCISEFWSKLFYVSDIDANSFEHFQLGASNLEKYKYLKNRRNTFWNQHEIVQYYIREDENLRTSKPVIRKS